MKNNFEANFKVDWVLNNELAVGRAPTKQSHIEILQLENIVAILSLCSTEEVSPPNNIESYFTCKRLILPDHKSNELLTLEQVNDAIKILTEIKLLGPVFVHCVASIERSPLICMAWLIKMHNLNPKQALDYLMEIHKGTNPLASQYKILLSL